MWWKFVLLLGLVSADFGSSVVGALFCAYKNPPEDHDRKGDDTGDHEPSLSGIGVVGVPHRTVQTEPWCYQAVEQQQTFRQWVAGLFSSLKITDLLLLVFTAGLYWVGRRQAETYESQRDIMAIQSRICLRMRPEEGRISFVTHGPHNRAYEIPTDKT